MITVIYSDGRTKNHDQSVPEYELAIACYKDDYKKVSSILKNNPDVDVNAAVIHSPTRGNGTPLILTGDKKIAQLLLEKGADVNKTYLASNDIEITPLDSAYIELTKSPVKENPTQTKRIKDFINFLEEHGAIRKQIKS